MNTLTREDANKLRNAIKEASDIKLMIEAKQDAIKDIRTMVKDDLGMKPKMFNKMVSVYHKRNYEEVTGENNEFEELYQEVLGAKKEAASA